MARLHPINKYMLLWGRDQVYHAKLQQQAVLMDLSVKKVQESLVSARAGQSAVMGRVSCTRGKVMLVLCVAEGKAVCSWAQKTYALAVMDCTTHVNL